MKINLGDEFRDEFKRQLTLASDDVLLKAWLNFRSRTEYYAKTLVREIAIQLTTNLSEKLGKQLELEFESELLNRPGFIGGSVI